MQAIDKLKTEINLLEYITKTLGQKGTNETQGVRFKAHPKDKNPSLLVYKDQAKGYMDYSGTLGGGSIIDFQMNYFNQDKKEAIKTLIEKFGLEDDSKKEFKKSPKRFVLAEQFEDFKLKGTNTGFSRFLQTRGVDFGFIQENKETINNIASEFGFCENLWIAGTGKEAIYKDTIIFPCYNENKIRVGAKLRTIDGTKFSMGNQELKSVSIGKPKDYTGKFPFSSGLIFSEISDKYVLIVEGETDYLILKLLGYKSVIGNLGGVSANSEQIQQLVKNSEKIVCLYDNDGPGEKATYSLQDKIGRPIRKVIYPKIDGLDKYDINDLFNQGWRKKDFDNLIRESVLLDEIQKQEQNVLFDNRIFYNNIKMDYYDVKDFSFKSYFILARHYGMKPKEFDEKRINGEIPTYEGICYYDGGKPGMFNLLDKSQIAKPSNNPEIHPEIKFLLSNLCGNKNENIIWLMKAILYKYTHLNDVLIPAVVFHGAGGTGKGLFIKLLSKIFGENNTQIGLTQDSIESRFSTYSGQKLIVEFKELSVDNTAKGKKNMQKLKTFIMEDKIIIEKKGQDPVSTENIAWFIMSSNENKPIQLDASDSGNRRFTIISTGDSIGLQKGGKIAKSLTKENIENFLAYLFEKFPEIPTSKNILPLENEDKKDLELLSESVGNLFFKWFEEKYPNVNVLRNKERNFFLNIYREEIGESDYINSDRYKISYFNSGLSVRYKIISTTINGEKIRGYKIEKEVKGGKFNLLPDGEIEKIIKSKNDLTF